MHCASCQDASIERRSKAQAEGVTDRERRSRTQCTWPTSTTPPARCTRVSDGQCFGLTKVCARTLDADSGQNESGTAELRRTQVERVSDAARGQGSGVAAQTDACRRPEASFVAVEQDRVVLASQLILNRGDDSGGDSDTATSADLEEGVRRLSMIAQAERTGRHVVSRLTWKAVLIRPPARLRASGGTDAIRATEMAL
jgi:hypothetical protein